MISKEIKLTLSIPFEGLESTLYCTKAAFNDICSIIYRHKNYNVSFLRKITSDHVKRVVGLPDKLINSIFPFCLDEVRYSIKNRLPCPTFNEEDPVIYLSPDCYNISFLHEKVFIYTITGFKVCSYKAPLDFIQYKNYKRSFAYIRVCSKESYLYPTFI